MGIGSFDLAALLAQVAAELQEQGDERPTVEAIVHKAVEVVPDVSCASVTIRARRRFVTMAASAEAARMADERQYAFGEGPCIEVAEGQQSLRSGDVGTDSRWPRWGPAAAGLGLNSLLSVPLYARGERIGALNFYSSTPGGFAEPDEVEVASLFALHAAHALASARLVNGLEIALSSRHTIGVAQGILVERYGLSVEQAFDVLRRISSQTNVKLAEVARQVVETGSLPMVDRN